MPQMQTWAAKSYVNRGEVFKQANRRTCLYRLYPQIGRVHRRAAHERSPRDRAGARDRRP